MTLKLLYTQRPLYILMTLKLLYTQTPLYILMTLKLLYTQRPLYTLMTHPYTLIHVETLIHSNDP